MKNQWLKKTIKELRENPISVFQCNWHMLEGDTGKDKIDKVLEFCIKAREFLYNTTKPGPDDDIDDFQTVLLAGIEANVIQLWVTSTDTTHTFMGLISIGLIGTWGLTDVDVFKSSELSKGEFLLVDSKNERSVIVKIDDWP